MARRRVARYHHRAAADPLTACLLGVDACRFAGFLPVFDWLAISRGFSRRLKIRGSGYQFQVPKLDVSPRLTARQGEDALNLAALREAVA
jgi:hypothetical protein